MIVRRNWILWLFVAWALPALGQGTAPGAKTSPVPAPSGGTTVVPAKAEGALPKTADGDSVAEERRRVDRARQKEVSALELIFFGRLQQLEDLFPVLSKAKLAPASGMMRVPLSARTDTEYGHRERELVHEDVEAVWSDGTISSLVFFERRSVQGGGPLRKRRWYLRPSFSDSTRKSPAGLSMHLIVDEVFASGTRNVHHFWFDTAAFLRNGKPSSEVPADAAEPDLRTVAVESQERRVSFLREAIRLTELLERRLVWVVKSRRLRDQQELDRVFRGR